MPKSSFTERRNRFRSFLERPSITVPASVFDAASARLAKAAGFELGLLGGSVASAAVLGAPDVVVMTLSEFAGQIARICRADLPLIVDADHGYGNALNVRRTVEELEAAGLAALTIEDALLPRAYGGKESDAIGRAEFKDKLRAAVDARSDPSLVVVGRTTVLRRMGVDEAVARVRLADEAGVDAVMVLGVTTLEQVEACHAATSRPLVLGGGTSGPTQEQLVANNVRVVFAGHLPYYVALQSLYDSYQHLSKGGSQAELRARSITPELQAVALEEAEHAAWAKEYLGAE